MTRVPHFQVDEDGIVYRLETAGEPVGTAFDVEAER